MSIIVHADDIGLTPSHTKTIATLVESGHLDRVSAIATGADFDEAVRELSRNGKLQWALHWNIVDGRSLLGPERIPLLVDGEGNFRLGLAGILTLSVRSPKVRRAYADQIRAEMEAQWDRFAEAGGTPVRVDSHRHVHLLPFVAPIAADIAARNGAKTIRRGLEPGRLPAGSLKGMLRRLLYNNLARRAIRVFDRYGLDGEKYIIGVRDAGRPDERRIQAGIRAASRQTASRRGDGTGDIELLFHPGTADRKELSPRVCRSSNAHFYASPERAVEARFLNRGHLSSGTGEETTSWVEYWNGDHIFEGMMEQISRHFARKLDTAMPLSANHRLLDIGCGSGAVSRLLAPRVASLCGTDTSQTAIEACRDASGDAGNTEYLVIPDAPARMPDVLGDRRFDRFVCLSVVQYFPDTDAIVDLVDAARSLANPGAELLIADIPGDEGPIKDALDLLLAAVRNRFLGEAVAFVLKTRSGGYRKVRAANGFLTVGETQLKELVAREGWDADILQGGLTFSRSRRHLRIRL